MVTDSPSSALSALGLDRAAEQLYFRVAPASGHTLQGMARLVHESPRSLLHDLAPLMELGLVELQDDRVVVPPMAMAVAELVRRESRRAAT
ncbi:hypothetical protein, partial [Nocardioides sp. P5_C9_2]